MVDLIFVLSDLKVTRNFRFSELVFGWSRHFLSCFPLLFSLFFSVYRGDSLDKAFILIFLSSKGSKQ